MLVLLSDFQLLMPPKVLVWANVGHVIRL